MKFAILAFLTAWPVFAQSPAPVTAPVAAPAPVLEKAAFEVKLAGRCYAYSAKVAGPGGHAESGNLPLNIPDGSKLKPGIQLLVDPERVVPWAGKYEGLVLHLANATTEPVTFAACDSRMNIVMQALNPKREWKDIEYLPASWCGNSYHTLELPAGHQWEFVVPKYSGPLVTKLRLSLTSRDKETIYSEPFSGSVHPKQFTVEEGHNAVNIMDPYSK